VSPDDLHVAHRSTRVFLQLGNACPTPLLQTVYRNETHSVVLQCVENGLPLTITTSLTPLETKGTPGTSSLARQTGPLWHSKLVQQSAHQDRVRLAAYFPCSAHRKTCRKAQADMHPGSWSRHLRDCSRPVTAIRTTARHPMEAPKRRTSSNGVAWAWKEQYSWSATEWAPPLPPPSLSTLALRSGRRVERHFPSRPQTSPQQTSPFLGVPTELRLMIFEYTLPYLCRGGAYMGYDRSLRARHWETVTVRALKGARSSMFSVCRQCRGEMAHKDA